MTSQRKFAGFAGVLALLVSVVLSTQVSARAGQRADAQLKVAHTPREVPGVFARYLNAGNVDNLIEAYYAPGAVIVDKPGRVKTGPALRANLAGLIASGLHIKVRLRHAYVSRETALLIVGYTLHGVDPAGKPLEIKGSSTDVARRQGDGSWKTVIDNPSGIK